MKRSVVTVLLISTLVFSISRVGVVLEGERNVIVLDLGDPLKPRIIQHYSAKSPVFEMIVYGRMVYLLRGKSVTVLKLDHNGNIAYIDERILPFEVNDIDVRDGKVVVSSGRRISVLDDDFRIIANLSLPWNSEGLEFFDDDHVLVSVGGKGIVMVDVSNPKDPRWIWRLESKDGEEVVSIDVSDRYAYVLGKKGLVFIVDLKIPDKPKVISYTRVFPIGRKIDYSSKFLYVLSGKGDIEVIDVSDPFDPFLKYRYESDKEIRDFQALGSILYISKRDGLYVMKFTGKDFTMIDYSPAVVPRMFAKLVRTGLVGMTVGEVIWSYDVGNEIRSSPAVHEGMVYFSSMNGIIYALDVQGNFKWNFRTKFLINSSPVVDKFGRIIVGSWDNYVYVLDNSGNLLWRFRTSGDVTKPAAVDGKRVYVGSEDGKLYAIEEGREIWSISLDGWLSTPVVVDSDGTLYFGTSSGKFYSVSYSGNVLWTFETGGWISSGVAVDLEGNLYFGSVDDYLYVLTRKGELLWKYDVGSDVTSGPTLDSFGRVIVGTGAGTLISLSRTGDLLWIFPTKGKIRSTPAVSKEGFVYFGSDDGYLYALNSDGSLRWKFLTGGKVVSSPVVLEKMILFGSSDGKFYALYDDTSGLDDGPWPMYCGSVSHNKITR